MNRFQPFHLSVGPDDLAGNSGRGRVVFLPGSDERARKFADRFRDVKVHPSPRQLNAYLGVIEEDGVAIDAACVPTGMGAASIDIVVTELIQLGARRFLRVGTAGTLRPDTVHVGHLVVATSAVRDEATSAAYAPTEFPAVAHPDWVAALRTAALRHGLADRTFAGVVHTKDSFYGREFRYGPLADRHTEYMRVMAELGVLATEMEAAHLFILGAVHNRHLASVARVTASPEAVKTGAVLAVIGGDGSFAPVEQARRTEERAITVGLSAGIALFASEK